jgi:predicted ferric reductase
MGGPGSEIAADGRPRGDEAAAPPSPGPALDPAGLLGRAAVWFGLYLLVCLVPLAVLASGCLPPGRGFWTEFGTALGMVGFGMLVAQCLTTARFRWVAPGVGSDAELIFHRRTGILAFLLVMAHPAVLIAANPAYLDYFNPGVNFLRAVFLIAATLGLVCLVVLPLWRLSFGMGYEWWRLTHGAVTAGVLLVGVAHAIQVGHYTNAFWKQALWAGFGGAGVLLVAHSRLVKPLLVARRPYRVAEVRDERGAVYTLVLEPDGHGGLRFTAGQYCWITLGDTPFTLQQHPFTVASSDARPGRVEFAIKEFGDFTGSVKNIPPGTRAFVEGPYGAFTLDPDPGVGGFFVAGGIGITPFLSMLRSCRDRGDGRRLVLIYANNTWDEVAFREELEGLRTALNLTVVHVLRDPPDGWAGETGYVDRELIGRYLPGWAVNRFHCYACGPEPLMDAAAEAFAALGVPPWRQASERFQVV